MTGVSRRNSAAKSMRGEKSFRAADEPVTKNGTSSDETPVLYSHRYSIKYPSPSALMTGVSKRNSAANSMRGGNSFRAAEEPEIITGTSIDETAISLAIFHYLNAKLRWVYLIIAIGTIGGRNNPQVTWAVMGIAASAWISKALKVLLNQRRPCSAVGIRADPGMPSSHAYTLLYIAVYLALALIAWKGLNTITFGMGLVIIISGAFIAWLRAMEGMHTHSQVMVGIILGSITAIIWYYTWNTIMVRHLYFSEKVRIFLHLGSIIVSSNL